MALTDIRQIHQQELESLLDFNIKHGFNLMVFGPTGAGKSELCIQACKRQNAHMTWCNLSVLERPDLGGYPRVNTDDLVTQFSHSHYLPLPETKYYQEQKALTSCISALGHRSNEFPEVIQSMQDRLKQLEKLNDINNLKKALPFVEKLSKFDKVSFIEYVKTLDQFAKENDQKVVVVFDEADKAPHEVMAPLLELLQFHSINGTKTAIHSCIITCNLPDENAQTEKLSHAITNRCFIYKLNVDFDAWRKWAIPNKTHPLIVGFLGSNKDMLLKKPDNKDDTAYAHPSPRSWTWASDALYKLENDPDFNKLGNNALMELKTTIMAGKVGDSAALKFEIWLKHYRELDPVIEAIAEHGKKPDWSKLDLEQRIVCAIGVCSRLNPELKPNNEKRIEKLVKNIFGWLENIEVDIQTAGVRNTFDPDVLTNYGIADMPEAMKIFAYIKKKTDNV